MGVQPTTPENNHQELDLLEQGFWLLSTAKWNNWYMYMQDTTKGNARGWKGDPGPQGWFKFKKQADGSYVISTAQWPNCYLYMQNRT